MTEIHQRTMAEVAESTAYGKLYRCIKVMSNGNRLLLVRYRRDGKRGELYPDKTEKLVIERPGQIKRECKLGDLWFCDNRNEWSLWALRELNQ